MLPVLPVPRFFEAGGTLGVLGLANRLPRHFAGATDDVSALTLRQLLARRATRPLSSMALADASSGSGSVTAGQLTKWINGLTLTFSSTTAVVVAPGVCRDKADAAFMQLSSAVTLDYATKDAIQGIQRKTLTGTAAATTANATVTGTGTAFKTEFGTRTGTGTIAGAATTITGTGTKLLSEVAVNDLIGTAAKGWSRVTAIASDTSLTLAAAIPGGDPTGTAPVIIEQPTIKVGTNTTQQVQTITSDTVLATLANGSAIVSGVTAIAGEVALTPTFSEFLFVWLVSGASGTGCVFSTQRTTPFATTGFAVSVRRIGVAVLSSAGLILNFSQEFTGTDRMYYFDIALNTNGARILAAGGASSFTPVVAANLAPPTATMLVVMAYINLPPVGPILSLRKRNQGDSSNKRALAVRSTAGAQVGGVFMVPCDGAQCIDYTLDRSDAGNVAFIDLAGFLDTL